ncbi:DinB family protein [Algoriphagus halophytocola]|uniref:DinB family protein n=1 Tax=Algoriphagus halophytocola TaxID=2991499 RepID=A0ABY6MNZ2_9BACT|nr:MULTISPECIES: DinB family protein [unclassified Algoriphagus]UZD24421.1 DinB family protein [Algoriphagus sp. TR-M5]WBL41785.1 DinB family protein [Algoriphagus sp. TR-M9]
MNNDFHIWENNRNIYLKFLIHNSLEELNKVPKGFNNNLLWNIGHVIAVQQRLVYGLAHVPLKISDDLFQKYKPGTKPEIPEPEETVELFKELLIKTIAETKADFGSGKLDHYTPYTTSKGFHLSSAAEAITFNNYHEALHLGTMVSLLKFIK